MRKILLALCLFAAPLQAQFKMDSVDFVRQYGINTHWKNPFTVVPDSQFLSWGYNSGGPGSVAKFTLLKTDTLKFFWATMPSTTLSIWSCRDAWSKGVKNGQCNSFNRTALITTTTHDTVFVHDTVKTSVSSGFIHDTTIIIRDTTKFVHDTVFIRDTIKVLGVAQWVFPRDTLLYQQRLALQTCSNANASIDSISGLMKLGCNLGKKVLLQNAVVADSGVAATLQMCMVSILSDSTVIWAKQSKAVCSDSIPKKKYGLRWHPEIPGDTTLVFSLAGASWH